MPPVPHPSARPVRFDDGAATTAAACFDELADRCDAIVRIGAGAAGPCTAEWRGASRVWFDHTNDATLAQIRRTAALARSAAEQFRQNVGRAARLQTERNHEAERADLVEIARLQQLAASAARP